MNIVKISIILFVTLLVVPVITFFSGTPLGELEWQVLKILVIISLISTAYCFIVGELSSNNSQVDKLWSLLPIAYVWIVAGYGDFTPRLVIMALLVSIWGIRLSINFALKGAYKWKFWTGVEDYRWKYLREKPEFQPRWKWTLFNLFFISFYQLSLILLFSLPALVALQFNETPMHIFDYVVAALMFFFIVYEIIADIQHMKYQNKKWALINQGKELYDDYKKGFLDKGLWAYSRHPNYFAEQAIWVCFYLFSITAGASWFNWSIAGCLLILILFQGSSTLSEEISASKYPEYKEYQKKTPRFLPLPRK